MSTPEIPVNPGTDPADPTPPVPEPTPEETAAQQAAAEAAAQQAALNDQIRALAAEIAKQAILEFDPATVRKGNVESLQTGSAPPTLTVTISGDTTTQIAGVRYYEHYPPQVGDTVHLLKQGTDLVAIGKIAEQFSETGFTDVPLANGNTHNGNGNGNLKVRRVWDNGVWRVDLQGSINFSGNAVICTALDAKYRPTSATRRTLDCTRSADGSNTVKADVGNDGTITLVGINTTGAAADPGDTGSTTPNDSTHSHGNHEHVIPDSTHQHPSHDHSISGSTAGLSEHNHAGAVVTVGHQHGTHSHNSAATDAGPSTHAHSGTTNVTQPNDSTHNHGGHAHTMGTHSHAVTNPSWVAFNGQSYFL